jgi:hypothetical protein
MRQLRTTPLPAWNRVEVGSGHRAAGVLGLLMSLLLTACGGGGDAGSDDPDGSVVESRPGESTVSEDAAVDTSDAPSDAGEPDPAPGPPESTRPPEPTTPPEPTIPAVDPLPDIGVEDIPDLLVDWAAASEDPSVGPLDVARRFIGFPLAVPVPEGATAFRVELDVFTGDPGIDWHWEWSYSAFANTAIGDIDITLEDNGPGAVELAETYDPIMAEMGWRRTGTTASDPGDPGGPNSVNHVYSFEGEALTVGEAVATPDPTLIWLDEDLVFDDEGTPGYQIDVNLDLPSDVIVVPLVESLHAALPPITGSRVVEIDVSSRERDADSFDADEGLRYLQLQISMELPAGSEEAAMDTYATDLDGHVYRAGEESFFDPGFYEPSDPTVSGDAWRQTILVLDRYPGSISITTDPDGGPAIATLDMTLEPNRELLQPLPA